MGHPLNLFNEHPDQVCSVLNIPLGEDSDLRPILITAVPVDAVVPPRDRSEHQVLVDNVGEYADAESRAVEGINLCQVVIQDRPQIFSDPALHELRVTSNLREPLLRKLFVGRHKAFYRIAVRQHGLDQRVAKIGFERCDLLRKDHPVDQVSAVIAAVVSQKVSRMVVGIHEDGEGVIGQIVVSPDVWLGFVFVFEPVVEVLDDLMLANIGLIVVLDALRIFPQRPSQSPEF
jgi:hypothetical protein